MSIDTAKYKYFEVKKNAGYENLTQHVGKLKIHLPVVSGLNCRQVGNTKAVKSTVVKG